MIPTEQHLATDQMDSVIRGMLFTVLGYVDNEGNPLPTAGNNIRNSWPTGGAPAWKIDEDVCFVQSVEADNQYDRLREVVSSDNTPTTTIIQDTFYTRVWEIRLIHYGPNSFDNVRKVRSSLFQQFTHDTLAGQGLYLVTDMR